MKTRINVFVLLFIVSLSLPGCIYKSNVPPLAVKQPLEKSICIKNVDVFTGNPEQDILKNVDILIKNNQIAKIGKFSPPEADCKIVDGKGKMVILFLLMFAWFLGCLHSFSMWSPSQFQHFGFILANILYRNFKLIESFSLKLDQ